MRIIAGLYKNRSLISPKGLSTRPTSERLRQALFNITQTYIQDATMLDLFAGSGAMGLEALSRGAKSAIMIDSCRESIRAIKENVQKLQLESQAQILLGDVFEQLRRLQKIEKSFDIIFADPPYDYKVIVERESKSSLEYLIEICDESTLLKPGGMLFLERPSGSVLSHLNPRTLEPLSSRPFGQSSLDQYRKN